MSRVNKWLMANMFSVNYMDPGNSETLTRKVLYKRYYTKKNAHVKAVPTQESAFSSRNQSTITPTRELILKMPYQPC